MHLSKQALQEDVHQLVQLLTQSHPDPYGSGGPLDFHRRAARIFNTIPEDGLSAEQFLRLVRPLVASIQDGHTSIGLPETSQVTSPRPWLDWDIVEHDLYLVAVYREEDRTLLGARLRAVMGMPLDDLLERISQVRGCDNEYQRLVALANAFATPALLADLLARDDLPQPLTLTLLMPDDTQRKVAFPLFEQPPGQLIESPTALTIRELDASRLG